LTNQKDYYVYLFSDVDGTPVYVGKGRGKRAKSHLRASGKKDSNDRLQKLISKREEAGFVLEPEIIAQGTETNMLLVEVALIQHLGRADKALGPLFNHTDGGDGVSNPSDEVRKKQADAMFRRFGGERRFEFINKKTGEKFEGNCPEFSKHIGLATTTRVNRLVREGSDLNSIAGWIVKGSGFVAQEYRTKFNFIHAGTKEKFTGTQAELVEHTKMSAGSASAIVRRKIKHALGWCLKEDTRLIPRIKKTPNGVWQTPENVWTNNQTDKSIVAWAMADEIMETFSEVKKIKSDVGAMGVMRSMGLSEKTTEKAVSSVISYFINWDIEPAELTEWVLFREGYLSSNTLPQNQFNGKIVDGRKKSNPESEERKNKILDLTSQGIGPAKIAEMVGVSRATVQKVKAKGLKQ
jgi:hypothetical protein